MAAEERAWTTPDRAAEAAKRMRKSIVSQMRSFASRLNKVADEMEAETPAEAQPYRAVAFGEYHPLTATMLFLGIQGVAEEVDKVCGVHPVGGALLKEARSILRALEKFDVAAEATRDVHGDGAVAIDLDADDAMRAIVGRPQSETIRVGDDVTWSEDEKEYQGKVVAISQGTAVMGTIMRHQSGTLSSVRGFKIKSVTEIGRRAYWWD